MIVLSDEPKAIVLSAARLLDLDANLRKLFTIDELAFKINEFIKELRDMGDEHGYMGTAGFYLFRYVHEGIEELMLVLSITEFHIYPDEPTQQFHHNDGPWVYDESVPDEWREEDEDEDCS